MIKRTETGNPYINTPTQVLINELEKLIDPGGMADFLGDDLEDDYIVGVGHFEASSRRKPGTLKVFDKFKEVCKQPPPILEFIKHKIDPNNPDAGFTKKQMELLMLSLMFRASPVYSAIPSAMADSAATGNFKTAQIICHNAEEELGGKKSHPDLLFESMQTLGNALHCQVLNDDVFTLVRHILHLRKDPIYGKDFGHLTQKSRSNLNDFERWENWASNDISLQNEGWRYEDSFKTAIYLSDLAPPNLLNYRDESMKSLLGGDEFGNKRDQGSKHQQYTPLQEGIRLLELATREASSADEGERLSYIGSWGKVVEAYQGSLSDEAFKKTVFWSKAHGDPEIGEQRGWGEATSTEDGHARDARIIAMGALRKLKPMDLVKAIEEVTRLTELRNKYWADVVIRLEELGKVNEKDNPKLPLSPRNTVEIKEPPKPRAPQSPQIGDDFVI